MSIQAKINLRSFKQRDANTFCSQATLTLSDGATHQYAIRTVGSNGHLTLDKENVYRFINGSWQPVNIDQDTADVLGNVLLGVVSKLRNVCKRKGTDKHGEFYQPYSDTFLFYDGKLAYLQQIKIGDLLIQASRLTSCVPYDLEFKRLDNLDADWRPIDELAGHKKLTARINKQLNFGYQKAMRVYDSTPIGFGSYHDLKQFRKNQGYSTGRYSY